MTLKISHSPFLFCAVFLPLVFLSLVYLSLLTTPAAFAQNSHAQANNAQTAAKQTAEEQTAESAQLIIGTVNQPSLETKKLYQPTTKPHDNQTKAYQTQAHQVPNAPSAIPAEPFSISTQVFQVTINQDGSENFTPISTEAQAATNITTLPAGSLLRFDVTYINQLPNRIHSAKARIDIPKGLVLEHGGFEPKLVYASLDGGKFYLYPIKLQGANGQPAPAAMKKYRALEWRLSDIKKSGYRKLSFRATKQ